MKAKYRIFTVFLAVILALVIAAFAVSADTAEEDGVPVLRGYTLSLDENVYILYAVDFGTIPDGAEYGMLVWEMEEGAQVPSDFTHASAECAADIKSAGWDIVDGARCEIFEYTELSAKQMTDVVYAVPYIRLAGESGYTYGEASKYSILQYTLGSAATEANANLLEKMLNYGAKAQQYFKYKTDTLANGEYVIARLDGALFSDGFSHSVMKPGEKIDLQATNPLVPAVSGTDVKWYMRTSDGRGVFLDGDSVTVPDSSFSVSQKVVIIDEPFDQRKNNSTSGLLTSAGPFSPNNKGGSTYVLIDADGGKYVKHCKLDGAGKDSQMDSSGGTFDIQDHLYDHTTGTFADKKLTVSIKLARTEADVATAKFNLRHYLYYGTERKTDYTTNVFSLTSDGTVKLGGKLEVGTLSADWQEFSFVVDFGAGDVAGANNLFAYTNGMLVGATRLDAFNTENFLVHTDDIERTIINFHTTGELYGELLFDDIRLTLGEAPLAEEARGNIIYIANGGKLPTDFNASYRLGEETELPTPTRENYEFVGWYNNPLMTEDSRVESVFSTKQELITLYAKFLPNASYVETLTAQKDAFLTSDFYRVDTDNQYNLSASAGGVSDKYALVDYGATVTVEDIIKLDTTAYTLPAGATPAGKQHPYLFFTASDIDKIKDTLSGAEFAATAQRFWSYANTEDFTGIFPEKEGVSYRFSTEVLAVMEAKALAYLLTGDEAYGLQAIIGAKNAMLTLVYTTDLHMDPYHGASQTMINVAKVYDWCYDLLSEKDKKEIILGVQNLMCPTMEYNYFQKDQGLANSYPSVSPVSGHGTGPQFIRDYVTVALAFYTEETSWWQYIGGRYFAEYAPVMDFCYEGGWASQGTATYGTSKYFINLWAAWIIRSATGITLDYATEEGGAHARRHTSLTATLCPTTVTSPRVTAADTQTARL